MQDRGYQRHIARKRFGQNFLNDPFIIANIIAAIRPQQGEEFIEIGPGLGALTFPLLEVLEKLTAIELDRDLAAHLMNEPRLKDKLILYQQDVLTVDFTQLVRSGKLLRVIGNLPYNISTPLLFYLFQYLPLIQDMCFMLQKEVVERLIAQPNTKSYGRLTVMAQYYCRIESMIDIGPEAFTPKPKVHSTLVKLIPLKNAYQVADLAMLKAITTQAFNQRRKRISNSLKSFFSVEQLSALAIDPNLRAENISVIQYCKLADAAKKHMPFIK